MSGERPTVWRGRLRLRVSSRKIGAIGRGCGKLPASPHFSKGVGASGRGSEENRIGKAVYLRTKGNPDADRGLSGFAPVEGRKVVAVFDGGRVKQPAKRSIIRICRSVAPSSVAPASEVIVPPSNAATTARPSTRAKPNRSALHSVCIGAAPGPATNRSRNTIFSDPGPRCTYPL